VINEFWLFTETLKPQATPTPTRHTRVNRSWSSKYSINSFNCPEVSTWSSTKERYCGVISINFVPITFVFTVCPGWSCPGLYLVVLCRHRNRVVFPVYKLCATCSLFL